MHGIDDDYGRFRAAVRGRRRAAARAARRRRLRRAQRGASTCRCSSTRSCRPGSTTGPSASRARSTPFGCSSRSQASHRLRVDLRAARRRARRCARRARRRAGNRGAPADPPRRGHRARDRGARPRRISCGSAHAATRGPRPSRRSAGCSAWRARPGWLGPTGSVDRDASRRARRAAHGRRRRRLAHAGAGAGRLRRAGAPDRGAARRCTRGERVDGFEPGVRLKSDTFGALVSDFSRTPGLRLAAA